MDKFHRMKELVDLLDEASKVYYQGDTEIISNKEYDALYEELVLLEKELNTTLAKSPTIKVGYEVLGELPKKEHTHPMLSLDKTKIVDDLVGFLGNNKGLLSWKLDGLTVVLTYDNGVLVEAVTRGNGNIGEVITENARTFKNVPIKIDYRERLVLRGEAVISYKDFEAINEKLEAGEVYKNPRNLCSGSVRQLNPRITKERNVNYYVFGVVEGANVNNSHEKELEFIRTLGFEHVFYKRVTKDNLAENVKEFSDKIKDNPLPSDGLVLIYDDIAYGKSLGTTAKFPRDAMAFKWEDEVVTTKLLDVQWSPSRTGLINPIAIFSPVELEGTTVARASLHNVSIFEGLEFGVGDEIGVYKANMIIPQVDENYTRTNTLSVPDKCPTCGYRAEIQKKNDSKELYCLNPDCPVKLLKHMEHFVGRNAMNIEGVSLKKLDALANAGIISDVVDIYKLEKRREEIEQLKGFGKKTYENIIEAVESSRDVEVANFINALGISGVGLQASKLISERCKGDINLIIGASYDNLVEIDKIGDIIAKSFIEYMSYEKNLDRIKFFIKTLRFKEHKEKVESVLSRKVFVITGKLEIYKNRSELKSILENLGASVGSAVSGNTDFLINNDINSKSSKNMKAKSLDVKIITELEAYNMINNSQI